MVADLDADHVVAGVDGQLDRGVGLADGAGHQLAGHPAGVVDQADRAAQGNRLDGERARPARRLRVGVQPGPRSSSTNRASACNWSVVVAVAAGPGLRGLGWR